MTGLKAKVGVQYMIGAIPKMEMTYVLGQKINSHIPIIPRKRCNQVSSIACYYDNLLVANCGVACTAVEYMHRRCARASAHPSSTSSA